MASLLHTGVQDIVILQTACPIDGFRDYVYIVVNFRTADQTDDEIIQDVSNMIRQNYKCTICHKALLIA